MRSSYIGPVGLSNATAVSWAARPRPWIMLFLLFVAYGCGAVDRLVVALLVEPIKADLQITDTQISILQGPAFVLVYTLFCLPAGYLVDRVHRIRFISIGISLWSLMTAVCGLANQYTTLLLARAGVGVGEATLSPASYSLISDSFPRERQGLVIGLYTAGSAVGAGLALMVGGYIVSWVTAHGPLTLPLIGRLASWQATFFVVGIPGLLLAAAIRVVPEPARCSGQATRNMDRRPFIAFLRAHRVLLICHHAAVGLSQAVLIGGGAWVASFLGRVHGWPIQHIGLAAGLATMIGGLLGLLGGGALSDWLFRRGPHLRLSLCAAAALLGAAAAVAFPLVADPTLSMVLFGLVILCAGLPFGAANAALQHIAPAHIRGRVSAVYLFSLSLVGSLGPIIIAAVGDRFFPFVSGIRYAMATVLPCALCVSGLLYLLCVRPYRVALRETQAVAASSAYGSE